MPRYDAKRALVGLAVLGATLFTAHAAAPAAHAAGSTPSITVIADAETYGVLVVAGANFSKGDSVQILMLEASTGAWNAVASTSSNRSGSFVKVFSFRVSCSAEAAGQVSLKALDLQTGETTASVVQALGTPVSLAQAQMAAAKTTQQVLAAQALMAAARARMDRDAAACQGAS